MPYFCESACGTVFPHAPASAASGGAVYVGGKTWTARSEGDEIIPAGAQVTVTRIEGVKLLVKNDKKAEVMKE